MKKAKEYKLWNFKDEPTKLETFISKLNIPAILVLGIFLGACVYVLCCLFLGIYEYQGGGLR